ncbi:hypothetical protein [Bacillus sp. JJ722]|uniref:hypothetical protein n=1 Tax=Bacillus sp. JJ722 TaxID=3122973 RepID=UPI002FFE23C4
MTNKLRHFKEESVATKIHEYLFQLPGVSFKDANKELVIGYYREKQRKFATLHGGSLQSLILHVDPGHPISTIGKQKQIELQERLDFDIRKIRRHKLKQHEAYIPLEKLESENPILTIEDLINYAYHKQDKL